MTIICVGIGIVVYTMWTQQKSNKLLFSVGGNYTIASPFSCAIIETENPGVLRDLGWAKTLSVDVLKEGFTKVRCGDDIISIEAVKPAVLKIELFNEDVISEKIQRDLRVGDKYHLIARLYDLSGREIPVGEYTVIDSEVRGNIKNDPNSSSGEFGLCPTCFGHFYINADKPGEYIYILKFQGLRAQLYGKIVSAP